MSYEQLMTRCWSGDGYAALARKFPKSNKWEEAIYKWPEDKAKVFAYIKDTIDAEANAYWCPTLLTEPRRKKEYVQPSNLLWADLDEVNPDSCSIAPTVAWESSPGRYQALWVLDKQLPTHVTEDINKRLSYAVGADKGGWDLTQVLRVPGLRNYKYPDKPKGKLLYMKNDMYNVNVFNKLPSVTSLDDLIPEEMYELPVENTMQVLKPYLKRLDEETIDLIFEEDPEAFDRSERLWNLECKLAEQGLTQADIVKICAVSPWNKFAGRSDEQKRLNIEAAKALASVTKIHRPTIEWVSYSDLQASNIPTPSWIIEEFWGVGEQGIIAGEPKTYKSVISTDLAISIATGKPFLGQYPVAKQGPVLMIQQENSPFIMKDRTMKIAMAKGLFHGDAHATGSHLDVQFPDDVPLYMLNNSGFDLTDKDCLKMLDEKTKEVEPLLVILDPMYLMLGGVDENSMKELRPILNWLLEYHQRHGCALILVHHWNKSGASKRGGQRMYGSVAWHGWIESAMYMQANDVDKTISVEREFRAFEKPDKITLKIEMGEPGQPGYHVSGTMEDKTDEFMSILSMGALSESEICAATSWSRSKVKKRLDELNKAGLLLQHEGGKGRGNATRYSLKN